MNQFEKARAQQYFDVYPKADVIYVTSDGQIFMQSNHNDAVTHQNHLTRQDPTAKMSTFYKKDLDKPTDEELQAQGKAGKQHGGEEEEEEEEEQEEEEQEAEQPAAEQPETEQPAAELPAAEQPATEQPATGKGRGGNKRTR